MPRWHQEWASGVAAAESLFAELRAVFRVVEPDPAKCFGSYGHQIRELLMLACMEVESGWKSVIRANGNKDKNLNREDYAKLLAPMRLAEWEVFLPLQPKVSNLRPFAKWVPGSDEPSEKLAWYDAYNGTKHGREEQFTQATLEHAISAVASVFIMVLAQFGTFRMIGGSLGMPLFQEPFGGDMTFKVRAWPKWPLGERYIPPRLEVQTRDMNDWIHIDCPGL